jgi:hypothetical protein
MSILPSRWMPPFPYYELPAVVRSAIGRTTLERVGRELWHGGVMAGRAEGIVGTSLVWIALILATLTLFVLIRSFRIDRPL